MTDDATRHATRHAARATENPTDGAAPPRFPLPKGHSFGVDPTPDCHTGRDPDDRAAVRLLQTRLVALGRLPGPDAVDGRFGDGTRSAVADLQRDLGLVADGRVGEATWALLWRAQPSTT